jgi:hypothetical protein
VSRRRELEPVREYGHGNGTMVAEGISWRSFWSRGPYGPIALKWGVKQWPTIYLIDAKGIIRMEGLRGPELDKAVEALVAEAEASIRSK